MKYKALTLLTALILLSFFRINAQQYSVSGKIIDETDNSPLVGAHVYLLLNADSIQKAAITDNNGTYLFKSNSPGEYLIDASFIGYNSNKIEIEVKDKNIIVNDLVLSEKVTELQGAQITENTPMATQIGDTTQYNADAFKVTKDATAEDLVEKMPGIVIEEGKVQAQGEDVKEVLVDGRPFFGNDPSAALRTLPAEVIDKIQIFDKKSEQAEFTGFDDGNTSKTLNVITRVNMRNGVFGKGYAGVGPEEKYMAGGNFNYFKDARRITIVGQSNNINKQNFAAEDLLGVMASSGGRGRRGGGGMRGGGRPQSRGGRSSGGDISDFMVGQQSGISKTNAFGVNYSDAWSKKVEVTASYYFNKTDNNALEDINREYFLQSDATQYYIENSDISSTNINHRANMRLNYTIDDNNSILIRPRVTLQQNDGASSVFGGTFTDAEDINESDNNLLTNLSAVSFSNSILYRHRFNKLMRTFSINIRTSVDNNDGDNELMSLNSYFSDPLEIESLDQNSTLTSHGKTISANIAYTEPLFDGGMLQITYSPKIQKEESDKETFDFDMNSEDYSSFNSELSNIFNSIYITHQIGSGYRYRKGSFNLSAGLNYQTATLQKEQLYPTEYDMSRNFQNILPTIFMIYRFAERQNLNISYRTNTSPPSINQLQDVIDNTNPLFLKTGNPDLLPSYQHNIFARFSAIKPESSRVFFILLGGGITEDYVANHTIVAKKDTVIHGVTLQQGGQFRQPVNLDGYWNLRSFLTYGFPLTFIKSNLNMHLSETFSRLPGMLNNEISYTNNNNVGLGIVLSSNISTNLDFTISSRSNYNKAIKSNSSSQNTSYFNQNTSLRFKWIFWKGLVAESTISSRFYEGMSTGYNQNFFIWNASFGKKLFKNERGELKVSVFDILDQNKNLRRNVSDYYVEDIKTNELQQYAMLTFTYDLRAFKNGEMPGNDRNRPPMPFMGRPGMGGPPPGM